MKRHCCCHKKKVRRGLWSPQEDLKLLQCMATYGGKSWSDVGKRAGLERCGKSCRLRWMNYLRPDLKLNDFSNEEEMKIIQLHEAFGNRWSHIASQMPGRTDNQIKNFWNSCIKKKISYMHAARSDHSCIAAAEGGKQEASVDSAKECLSSFRFHRSYLSEEANILPHVRSELEKELPLSRRASFLPRDVSTLLQRLMNVDHGSGDQNPHLDAFKNSFQLQNIFFHNISSGICGPLITPPGVLVKSNNVAAFASLEGNGFATTSALQNFLDPADYTNPLSDPYPTVATAEDIESTMSEFVEQMPESFSMDSHEAESLEKISDASYSGSVVAQDTCSDYEYLNSFHSCMTDPGGLIWRNDSAMSLAGATSSSSSSDYFTEADFYTPFSSPRDKDSSTIRSNSSTASQHSWLSDTELIKWSNLLPLSSFQNHMHDNNNEIFSH